MKVKTKSKRIALIDGDGLIHGAKWRNKFDTMKYGPITLKDAIANYERSINECLKLTWASDYAIAVKGPNNYRDTMYSEYKKSTSRAKNRDDDVPWLGKLKEYAENREGTVVCDGYEADDLLRIWACEIRDRELVDKVSYIICTGDKDLDCIWGQHYQFRRTGMGPKLYKVDPIASNNFFWEQSLTGDTIDNIPGIKGVAHKTAIKLFGGVYTTVEEEVVKPAKVKDKRSRDGFMRVEDPVELVPEEVTFKKVSKLTTEPTHDPEEREKIVVKTYVDKHGIEDGYNRFLMNCKLLYMWKHYGEHFTYDKEKFIALASS
jgi:5'-3' exonuclease